MPTGGNSKLLKQQEAVVAHVQKPVGGLNSAQASVSGRAGRVASNPLYDLAMRGGAGWINDLGEPCHGGSRCYGM